MRNGFIRLLGAACLLTNAGAYAAETCDMNYLTTHGEEKVRIYTSTSKVRSLYYAADMAVNTDGTPRSYHPADPRANKGLAFNNMANAMTSIYDADGKSVNCDKGKSACFTKYMTVFEQSREANYRPSGVSTFNTTWIIPWKQNPQFGWPTPCLIETGPFKGYFVSQTSVNVDATKNECDQARYLDSLKFKAVVLPKYVDWPAGGIRTDDGDLVVVRDLESGRVAFAINGDRGPEDGIGEGSIALTSYLSGVTIHGTETYEKIKLLHRDRVQYVTFPADDIRRKTDNKFSQADIDREGKKLFEEWGGLARLDACKELK